MGKDLLKYQISIYFPNFIDLLANFCVYLFTIAILRYVVQVSEAVVGFSVSSFLVYIFCFSAFVVIKMWMLILVLIYQ